MKKEIWFSLVLLWTMGACKPKSDRDNVALVQEEVIPIRTAMVKEQSLVFPIHFSGVVTSGNEAKPAFKTGGVIKRVFVEEGDAVLKGQLLATLNLTEINALVQQAEEGLDKARRDLQRVRNLYADSVATLEQLQNATTALRLSEESIQIAKFNQNYSEVRAPISGKVIKKFMSEGEVVGPGMPVFYILGNTPEDWVVKAGISDRDWARLKVGDAAELKFDAFPEKSFSGRVKRLADMVNPQSGTFDVELELLVRPPRLATGLVGSGEIFPEGGSSSLVIPVDALVESEEGSGIVYVVKDSQYVKRTAIKIGRLHLDKVVILEGLKQGMLVATDGGPFLVDGRKINIVE